MIRTLAARIVRRVGIAAFACTLPIAVMPADAQSKMTVMVNAIGPVGSDLYVANADGTGERPLLGDAGFDYDASFSADGNWIVYTSERGGPANIFRVRLDGSGREQLTDNNGFDDQAALSPDGRTLAFVSTRGGGVANIWLKELTTGNLRSLTRRLPADKGKLRDALRPSWAPDGKWIAFSSDRGTQLEPHAVPSPGWEHIQRSSVYIIRADGAGLKMLSDGVEYGGSPKWSADGKSVVYYSMPPEETFGARTVGMGAAQLESARIDSCLKQVDVVTGKRVPLTTFPGLDVSPQYLADGRIAYLRKGPGFEKGRLAYWNAGANNDVAEGDAPGDMRNPAWSPDGNFVVYQKYRYGLRQGQHIFSPDKGIDLRFSGEFPAVSRQGKVALTAFPHDPDLPPDVALSVADPDGSNMRELYRPDNHGAVMSPSWSPDGKQIVVGKGVLQLGAPMQLALIDAENGTLIRMLTNAPGFDNAFPSFSPDGKRIVYRVKGKGVGLRILTLADGSVQTLTEDTDNFPFWSPDAARICFTRFVGGVNAFDIFSIRPDGSDLRRIVAQPGNDSHCGWTPDSKSVIFSSSQLGHRDEAPLYDRGASQPYAELFIANADGSNPRPITDDKWEEATPAVVPGTWLPQGK